MKYLKEIPAHLKPREKAIEPSAALRRSGYYPGDEAWAKASAALLEEEKKFAAWSLADRADLLGALGGMS